MHLEDMRIQVPDDGAVGTLREICEGLLPLEGARVLELGCGKAELTRQIAGSARGVSIVAMEVDRVQHALNLEITDLPNVRFEFGGAENIPAPDGAFDIVLMFKSLHHVPVEHLDRALREIHRVLRPGGFACLAEPVAAGDFNDLMSLFHDEQAVRREAFAAIRRAVAGGRFELLQERFFQAPVWFRDFADFESRTINVTHTEHRLTREQRARVEQRFAGNLTPEGALFHQQMRVDLLRKPVAPR